MIDRYTDYIINCRPVNIIKHYKKLQLFTLIISPVFIPEAEKTIALGGVATGSIKAKLHVTVAGIIRYSGLVCVDLASSASTGSRMLAVAMLEVTSVMMPVIEQIINTTAS